MNRCIQMYRLDRCIDIEAEMELCPINFQRYVVILVNSKYQHLDEHYMKKGNTGVVPSLFLFRLDSDLVDEDLYKFI